MSSTRKNNFLVFTIILFTHDKWLLQTFKKTQQCLQTNKTTQSLGDNEIKQAAEFLKTNLKNRGYYFSCYINWMLIIICMWADVLSTFPHSSDLFLIATSTNHQPTCKNNSLQDLYHLPGWHESLSLWEYFLEALRQACLCFYTPCRNCEQSLQIPQTLDTTKDTRQAQVALTPPWPVQNGAVSSHLN